MSVRSELGNVVFTDSEISESHIFFSTYYFGMYKCIIWIKKVKTTM